MITWLRDFIAVSYVVDMNVIHSNFQLVLHRHVIARHHKTMANFMSVAYATDAGISIILGLDSFNGWPNIPPKHSGKEFGWPKLLPRMNIKESSRVVNLKRNFFSELPLHVHIESPNPKNPEGPTPQSPNTIKGNTNPKTLNRHKLAKIRKITKKIR